MRLTFRVDAVSRYPRSGATGRFCAHNIRLIIAGFFFFYLFNYFFFKCDATSLLSECLDWVVFSCDQVTRMIKSTVGWGSTIHFPLIKISWEFRDQKCGYKSSIRAERTSVVVVNAIEPEKRCWISLGLAEQIDGLLMLMFRKDTFGRYARRCTTRRFYSNDNCLFLLNFHSCQNQFEPVVESEVHQKRPCLNVGLLIPSISKWLAEVRLSEDDSRWSNCTY